MAKHTVINCTTGEEQIVDLQDITRSADELEREAKALRALSRAENAKAQASLSGVLKTITPEEAEAYVLGNVTDLQSARQVMSKMARMIIALRDAVMADVAES